MKLELKARDILKLLNGFICVYKPRDVSISALKRILVNRICEDGNAFEEIVVPEIEMPIVQPHPVTQAPIVIGMQTQLDYTQHPLMSGRLFHPNDFEVEELHYSEPTTSGVCLFAIGTGCEEIENIKEQTWVNEYVVDAELGKEKYENNIIGKVTGEAVYDHVTEHKMQKLLSRIQAQFKRASFELMNVDPQSQEAFEIARKGAPRPKVLDNPVVYNMELIRFMPPYFSLRLNVTSENDPFLRGFIRELALGLGTISCTRRLRRHRLGPFGAEHALLEKQFHLPIILKNILMCNQVIKKSCTDGPIVKPRSQEDMEMNALISQYGLDKIEENEEEDCLRIPWGREYTTVNNTS